jgi:Domain of unknown function (DUF4276)
MSIDHLEALVEEPSMAAALRGLLPKLIGLATYEIYPHRGRADLLRKLPERLRTYRQTLQPGQLVMVLIDRDSNDCLRVKAQLEQAATAAGLITRSNAAGRAFMVLNRIAVEELESWYFGDWAAVRKAYPRAPAGIAARARFRTPDAITGGTWEAFEQIMRRAGYFPGGLIKVEAAEQIAPHMEPARNTSRSFQVFRDALLEVTA